MDLKKLSFVLTFVLLVFYAGVHAEHSYKVTKNIFWFDGYYERKEHIAIAKDFKVVAKRAISEWKAYHLAPNQVKSMFTALESSQQALVIYGDINMSALPSSWVIQSKYFKAYMQLICADIDGIPDCLSDLSSELALIKELLNSDELTEKEKRWLKKVKIPNNVNILDAQLKALIYYRNNQLPSNLEAASKALKLYGTKEKLLALKIDQDRILGRIFHLTFGETDNYRIPE